MRDEPGEHRPQARDDERLEVVERDARDDRRRAPDDHHADRDGDRRRGAEPRRDLQSLTRA